MVWSPDGSVAAVRAAGGLRLVGADGTLSDNLADDVTGAAWLPDGSGLILLRATTVTNWSAVAAAAPAEDTRIIEAVASALPSMLRGAVRVSESMDSLLESFIEPLGLTQIPYSEGLLYLRDTQPEMWQEMLQIVLSMVPEDEAPKAIEELTATCRAVIHEISILPMDGARPSGPPRVIERGLRRLAEPRPSPSAPVLAVLREDTLILAPLDGGDTRAVVAERVTGSYDWTPDGRSLVFAVRTGKTWETTGMNLAHIQRREAIGADGAIQPGRDELLAVSLYAFLPRVRSLPDGRVLFAGVSATLPVALRTAGEARFYIAGASGERDSGLVPVPSASGSLPTDLGGFAVSPDGRRVAVAEAGSDAVAVLDLATGAVEVVSPARGARSQTLPAWRANGDLYFAALPEAGARRADWMRWSGSEPSPISAAWPADLTEALLQLPSARAGSEP